MPSSWSRSIRKASGLLLPYNNRRTTSPPGRLSPGPGTPVIVASLMRSGTHLLIDLILNNFRDYKKSPLYVELDTYLYRGLAVGPLFSCGRRVLKTHYPQLSHRDEDQDIIHRLAKEALIISPQRDPDDVLESTADFGYPLDRETFRGQCRRFEEFWALFPRLIIPFEDLLREEACRARLDDIEAFLRVRRNPRTICPPEPKVAVVYWLKGLTRCLGRHAPVVNTTIHFRGPSRQGR